MTATLDTFMTSMTAGNISAIRFPARRPVMTPSLAVEKRSRSSLAHEHTDHPDA